MSVRGPTLTSHRDTYLLNRPVGGTTERVGRCSVFHRFCSRGANPGYARRRDRSSGWHRRGTLRATRSGPRGPRTRPRRRASRARRRARAGAAGHGRPARRRGGPGSPRGGRPRRRRLGGGLVRTRRAGGLLARRVARAPRGEPARGPHRGPRDAAGVARAVGQARRGRLDRRERAPAPPRRLQRLESRTRRLHDRTPQGAGTSRRVGLAGRTRPRSDRTQPARRRGGHPTDRQRLRRAVSGVRGVHPGVHDDRGGRRPRDACAYGSAGVPDCCRDWTRCVPTGCSTASSGLVSRRACSGDSSTASRWPGAVSTLPPTLRWSRTVASTLSASRRLSPPSRLPCSPRRPSLSDTAQAGCERSPS